MNTVAATDFRNNFSTYFGQVAFGGEELLIKKGKKILKLSLTEDTKTKKLDIMDLAGIITDEEANEMKRVIKSIRDLDNDPLRHFKRN
jgi:antitoxin (DNA-binding transcriptional repressor) of toxin-antitoxin stability system